MRQGSATRSRTAAALLCAGALTVGGGAGAALAQGDTSSSGYPSGSGYPGCGAYPGGTYPGGYPGGTYPGGRPCTQTTTQPGTTQPGPTDRGTTDPGATTGTTPTTTGVGAATRPRRPVEVVLDGRGSWSVRVPKGGLLTLGRVTCPAGSTCPDIVVMLGRPRSGTATAASLAGTYGRKVVGLPSGQSRTLRVRVKKSAVRAMLRHGGRLPVRLVISNPTAPPIVRSLTLSR